MNQNNRPVLIGAGLALGASLLIMSSAGDDPKEINWQEFKTKYLETGMVERLVVANKGIVKVYLRNAPVCVSASLIPKHSKE